MIYYTKRTKNNKRVGGLRFDTGKEIKLTSGEIAEYECKIREYQLAERLKQEHDGYFKITSVHRDDLESIGFNTRKVDDGTMERLASKMADAYCENCFWIDLPIIAEYLEIPEHKHNKK